MCVWGQKECGSQREIEKLIDRPKGFDLLFDIFLILESFTLGDIRISVDAPF